MGRRAAMWGAIGDLVGLEYASEPAGRPFWLRSVEYLLQYGLLCWQWSAGRWSRGPRSTRLTRR